MAVLERVLHHEEREEQKQFQHLRTGEFAVMPFLDSYAREIVFQTGDCTDYTINCPVTIILEENESIPEVIMFIFAMAFSMEPFLIAL